MLGVHRCRSVSIVAAQGPKMGDTLVMENTRFNLIYGYLWMMFPLKGGCPLPPLRHIWELNCGSQIHPNPPSPDLLLGLSEWETNRNAAGLGDSGFGEENMCQFSMIESCILHHLYIIIMLLLFQWSVIDALSARSRCLDTNWRSTEKLSLPQDTVDQADGRRDPKPAIKGSSSSGDQRTRNGAKNLNLQPG